MTILVSHGSALEFYRANPNINIGVASCAHLVERVSVPSIHEVRAMNLHRLGIRQHPLNVIIGRESRHSRHDEIAAHKVCCEIDGSWALPVWDGILVTSPALTYVLMARTLSDVGAIVLGYELCGSYSHFAPRISGFYDRRPLVTKALIEETCGKVRGVHGVKRARSSIARVAEGSASPTETLLSCMLSFPAKDGGFGLPMPRLNWEVELDRMASELAGSSFCKVDMGWPDARVAFEYDSDLCHDDPAKDRRRREALLHMGWKVFTVDLPAMRRHSELVKLVNVAGCLIVGERCLPKHDVANGEVLLSRLRRATRWGLGIGEAVFAEGQRIHHSRIHIC